LRPLRYGLNPHQQLATVASVYSGQSPFSVVHGEPSYLNLLDALGAWQLVREASTAFGRPAAASFKHVSPAGAAVAGPIDAVTAETFDVTAVPGALTSAYVRARDTDPQASYGDFVAVSEPVDAELADLLRRLVVDGIIAPGFEPGTVGTLAAKKRGRFLVLEADPAFAPPPSEVREVYGVRLTQERGAAPLTRSQVADPVCGALDDSTVDDLLLGLITVRYTQSNSVAYVRDGATLGVGAGQQSRIGCVRLAGSKVDSWWLRRHPAIRSIGDPTLSIQDRINRQLDGLDDGPADRTDWLAQLDRVSLASDGALPFRDNVDHARRHGVRAIAEPGGSIRSDDVASACREHGITLVHTGIRLFHH
jgi:phosphoribosylaminoimidazolecarboxamide formyltransferase/IMP cyclohydrolase